MSRPIRILHVVTSDAALLFFRGQTKYMRERGVDLHFASSAGDYQSAFVAQEGANVHTVDMARAITPFADVHSIWKLMSIIRSIKPDIVHGHTPKGGLLAMTAALASGVPLRFYTIRGLAYETAIGWRRGLLTCTERLSCALAKRTLCVSSSLAEVVVSQGICSPVRIEVLAGGSGNGVDAQVAFRPEGPKRSGAHFGLNPDALVIGFVGRIVKDKGIEDLALAWKALRVEFPTAELLLVGAEEPRDPVDPAVIRSLKEDSRVHMVGQLRDVRAAYASMDVLALPSHREGLPNVVLEASAMGLPVVATDLPGCRDCTVDGRTATVVPIGAPHQLASAIREYLLSPDLRVAHGMAGRTLMLERFKQTSLWDAMMDYYRRAISRPDTTIRYAPPSFALLVKRLVDIGGAIAALLLLAPIIAALALLVRVCDGAPVLFAQRRAGLQGRVFTLYKFRTMAVPQDGSEGDVTKDSARTTRMGRMLRTTSLDELPQLWNVLRGDISLVGPRPLLEKYTSRYTREQARRLDAKPGITGWAQVNGRNALSWEEKFSLDAWYVRHWSLWLDLRIIALTLLAVVKRSGISADGYATMPEFLGTDNNNPAS